MVSDDFYCPLNYAYYFKNRISTIEALIVQNWLNLQIINNLFTGVERKIS